MKRIKRIKKLRKKIIELLRSSNDSYNKTEKEEANAYWLGRQNMCELLLEFIDGPDGRAGT